MSIRVTCEKCGVVLKVKEELAGTKGKCPSCKGTLNVPTLEQAAAMAAARVGATETAPAAAIGDTGALKIPTKSKTAEKAGPTEGASPPPPEANGSSVKQPPAAEAPPENVSRKAVPVDGSKEAPPSTGEADADAAAKKPSKPKLRLPDPEEDEQPSAPAAEAPKPSGKPKLRMSDTDAEDAPAASEPEKPAPRESQAPAAEEKPAPKSAPAAENKAKAGEGDFDLDSFLMEGPKPKPLPPVPEEGKKAPPRAGGGRRLSMSDDETNVSGPSETLPPPNRGRGGAAESALAALTGGNATASSAKDLLNRASQEGRARASQMPDEQKERFDYAGAIKQIGKEYGLHVLGTIVLCVVLYAGMNHMMGSNVELPPLARVYGKVTLKKHPVAGVVVNFTPVGQKDAKDGPAAPKKGALRSASAVTDSDGNYELMYMEGVRGAVVGQNRVWIAPQAAEDFKKIPGNYQSAGTSGDIREVKATGGEENIDL